MIRRKKTAANADGSPTFGAVWKVFMMVCTGAASIALTAMFGWVWAMQNSMTKLTAAMDSNTDAIKIEGARIDELNKTDTSHTAALATLQAQIANTQANQAASAISLSERIRAIEQQNMWRERMQQQPARGR